MAGTELKGVWGGTLMHEDVLANMEPRMEPELQASLWTAPHPHY